MAEEGFHDYTLATRLERSAVQECTGVTSASTAFALTPPACQNPLQAGGSAGAMLQRVAPHRCACQALYLDLLNGTPSAVSWHARFNRPSGRVQPPCPDPCAVLCCAGLENISHLPPALGADRQPINLVRVSSNINHRCAVQPLVQI